MKLPLEDNYLVIRDIQPPIVVLRIKNWTEKTGRPMPDPHRFGLVHGLDCRNPL